MQATPQDSAARRYRIEKYLTEGGMGAIYIGKKLGPGGFAKEVVLKQLLPEYTARPEFRDLFFREAKISATLDHANIVHTFDLVESDQSLFIVMEYVRGADLRTIIRRARHRKRELSPAAAIHVALEILAGLGYAHARRDASGKSLDIIHRDVSPSNIICSVQGAAKLSDFGIAKASTYSSVFYRVRGKVGYMSPEQARSQTIDHRCDLYSLSVCLYESLSGERLFVGDLNTPADEIYGIPILPASQKRPGLPPALDDVLARALAPNVDDRYQSAAELGEALRTVAHRTGLAFSAPELAAHLHDILGDDPERWLRDESPSVNDPRAAPAAAPDAEANLPATSDLVGTEASSIGIVIDIAEDEPARSVLSPSVVSRSKDFDLDSMLDDEATRPGGDGKPPASSDAADGRVQAPATPPAVWTRNSSPFPLATPKPVQPTVQPAPPPAIQPAPPPALRPAPPPALRPAPPPALRPSSRALPGISAPPPGLPPAAPSSRPLPRATLRTGAVPPPFSPSGRFPAPPPPPLPPGGVDPRLSSSPRVEIEDVSPIPPAGFSGYSPRQPSSFDIEDATTPAPAPALGGGPPSPPSHSFRHSPPAPYPSSAIEPPLVLHQPETIDFQDSVPSLLPEKGGGPPVWLAAVLVVGALVGGASLAHRVTAAEVAALTIPPASTPTRADRRASGAPNEIGAARAPDRGSTAPTPQVGDPPRGASAESQRIKEDSLPPREAPAPRQDRQGSNQPPSDGPTPGNLPASAADSAGGAPQAKPGKHRRSKRHKKLRNAQ